ncbi:MAG: hypothetical protein LQ349_009705, partial [Xanthoria aureola]
RDSYQHRDIYQQYHDFDIQYYQLIDIYQQYHDFNIQYYQLLDIDIDIISLHSIPRPGRYQSFFRTRPRQIWQIHSAMEFHRRRVKFSPDKHLLSGVPQSTTSLSQTINTLVAGKTYTLQYFYDLPGAKNPFTCGFTVTIRGQVVDSFTSAIMPSGSYTRRSITYQNSAAGPAVLSFSTSCGRFANPNQSNLALDAITLVTVPAACS